VRILRFFLLTLITVLFAGTAFKMTGYWSAVFGMSAAAAGWLALT
jgi:hypothetical protein